MKLKIIESSWSGWTKDYKPNEKENLYDIKLNEKYLITTRKFKYLKDEKLIEEEREIFSFVILEINLEKIKIKTFQPFYDNGDGLINLRSEKKEFIIHSGSVLKLVTPTKDEGDVFYLSLIK